VRLDEPRLIRDAHAPRWRQAVADRLVAAGLEPARRAAAELALHEALCNALEHGHRGDTTVGIALELTQLRPDRLVVHVVDRALGGPWSPPNVPAQGTRRGHGLALIRAGCDELRITAEPGATHVAMTFVCARHPASSVGANGLER
jgi:anti-sigma regulatory factor (Ser/Thr protein kinase)